MFRDDLLFTKHFWTQDLELHVDKGYSVTEFRLLSFKCIELNTVKITLYDLTLSYCLGFLHLLRFPSCS